MKRTILILALAGTVAACDGPGVQPQGDDAQAAARAADAARAKAQAQAVKARTHGNGARSVSEQTDDFLFEYAYPAEAGLIPELARLLDDQLDERRSELATESASARRGAREQGFPYNKHSYTAEWKVVADLPGWLSLSNEIATYTGGAHGNYTVSSLVWSKEQMRAFNAKELFSSPAALEEAYGKSFCDGLNAERAKRRGAPVAAGSEELFDNCPGIEELEVLVGSSNRRTFNRLTLYAGPYVAGPYAEGAYEVNLPVTRAVVAAVKPEYQGAFSARN